MRRTARAQIEVEDTGIGIAPENLPHIFQPFYRVVSEVEGTGLGLSIAKEIVEMHGGNARRAQRAGRGQHLHDHAAASESRCRSAKTC